MTWYSTLRHSIGKTGAIFWFSVIYIAHFYQETWTALFENNQWWQWSGWFCSKVRFIPEHVSQNLHQSNHMLWYQTHTCVSFPFVASGIECLRHSALLNLAYPVMWLLAYTCHLKVSIRSIKLYFDDAKNVYILHINIKSSCSICILCNSNAYRHSSLPYACIFSVFYLTKKGYHTGDFSAFCDILSNN